MITLQINTAGAWKNLVQFDDAEREEVLTGLKGLAQALGDRASWCLLHDDGHREWLRDIGAGAFPGWEDDPAKLPPSLQDVMVSVYDVRDGVAMTLMAWRSDRDPPRWHLTGTDETVPFPVYAWGPSMAPHKDVPEALKQPGNVTP
jgi:hypothetical protein